MVQQSRQTWQQTATDASRGAQASEGDGDATVGDWMRNVLGQPAQAPQPPAQPASQPTPPPMPGAAAPLAPSNDLQSRLAAIAKNIERLESKVTATPESAPAPYAEPAHQMATAAPQAPSAPADPLEALRRRKRELEGGAPAADAYAQPAQAPVAAQPQAQPPVFAEPAPQAPQPQPQPEPAAPQPAAAAPEPLTAHLDAQFERLTQALDDVRSLAQESAQALPALDVVPALQQQIASLEARLAEAPAPSETGSDLAALSEQVRAVQDTLSAMPAPDAIRSLEDGYKHILTRLDGLKGIGTADEKIDALYGEVTGLREALDALSQSGSANVLDEMRSMIGKLEQEGQPDQPRILAALEEVSSMARGVSPDALNESIGAVVERIVALEARIEALASGSQADDQTAQRLDAIQDEIGRLNRFHDEMGGLSDALEAIRSEMRDASPPAFDPSIFDTRFSALDRIEETTGGYAEQIAALSARLDALDGSLANQSDVVRQVAALSRQVDTFTNTIPVREIEQALLDLTGRVTALQEAEGNEGLSRAVRQLGERVDAIMAAMPQTDALVDAVEARLKPQFAALDDKVDSLNRAISADDSPLIERIASRVEMLIAAMPQPRADEALAKLEEHLTTLNDRFDAVGILSRDEVQSLSAELARVRSSVELGSNRDLQRSIVDQVRQLADRFDHARATGDASLLPEIETQLDALSDRVQRLGLFGETPAALASPAAAAPSTDALSDKLAETIEAGLSKVRTHVEANVRESATAGFAPGVSQLQDELSGLRRAAQEQDQRLHDTLGMVHTALEKVVDRIENLESDDKAALSLAKQAKEPAPQPTLVAANDAPADAKPEAESDDPLTALVGSLAETDKEEAAADGGAQDANAQPNGAQDLLRQLSGAMEPAADEADAEAEEEADGENGRLSLAERRAARSKRRSSAAMSDEAGAQRASFIAAARRAAQQAALQAASGAQPGSVEANDAVARLNAIEGKDKPDGVAPGDVEPGLTVDGRDPFEAADPDRAARAASGEPPERMSDDLSNVDITPTRTAKKKSKEDGDKKSRPAFALSRISVFAIALLLFGAVLL
ncbi:MAG: hypothetical protein KI785_15045, partial [Devosiaceae bacterium]|nr:hypothetical protein [Devosiaceae bacterium MH13]